MGAVQSLPEQSIEQQCPHIVLSGKSNTGKTTLAEGLSSSLGYLVLSAREVLRELANDPLRSRIDLQEFGAVTEERTRGKWLASAAADAIHSQSSMLIVDSVRTQAQLARCLEVLEPGVFHTHLLASGSARADRLRLRVDPNLDEPVNPNVITTSPIEAAVDELAASAGFVLDTGPLSTDAVLDAVLREIAHRSI